MVINKHSSFYMRNGWGTKIIQAVTENDMIFTPSNEQEAIDSIGLGRIMIKALRYWSGAMGLTTEIKTKAGVQQIKTDLFRAISDYDMYFQKRGSLLMMHRELALNKENCTSWYWFFNEWEGVSIDKDEFIDGFHSYLAVNGMKIKKDAVNKEFNCFRNTYISKKSFSFKNIMDDDTYPFLAPLKMLYINENKRIQKAQMTKDEIPIELLIYSIAMDNTEESSSGMQVSIDKLIEEKKQIGKYFGMGYSKLMESLIDAENKKYIRLENNFGNRYIEFVDIDYTKLLEKYYCDGER